MSAGHDGLGLRGRRPQLRQQQLVTATGLMTICGVRGAAARAVAQFHARGSFARLGVRPRGLDALAAMGITRPSEIQALAIPPILERRDVVIMAQTGSGKTLAYGVPLAQLLEGGGGGGGGLAGGGVLVVVPTRELVAQVAGVLRAVVPRSVPTREAVGSGAPLPSVGGRAVTVALPAAAAKVHRQLTA